MTQTLENYLALGYEVAPIAALNDLDPNPVFRSQAFDSNLNVAIRREDVVVVRLSSNAIDDEALAEAEALFDSATPCIVAPGFQQWLVTVPHFKVAAGTVGGGGPLQFAEIGDAALAPPSRLFTSEGSIATLSFANAENVLPARATDALILELSAAGKLPHGALDVIRGFEDD